MNVFSHSGDIGDIIYSLPTIRACGGGELVLFNFPGRTSQPMSIERYLTLKPLLEFQSYIFKVRFTNNHEDSSLNGFRDHVRNGENCADWHLCTHGLPWEARTTKWLTVPEPLVKNRTIIAWTPRYHCFDFPWTSVINKYGDDLGFLGYEQYYKEFCKIYNTNNKIINYIKTDNFLNVAQIIEGCSLYIGNLTSMTAIAEGLKKKIIIEGFHNTPANHFIRQDSVICYSGRLEI